MSTITDESTRVDAATEEIEGTDHGPDPDKGKLFEVPRVAVHIDDTDPTVLKLSFSGSIELERGVASDVELYNQLRPGRDTTLSITAHVAGAKTTHRRDSEGDVDAVVQTKSLIIHSIDSD